MKHDPRPFARLAIALPFLASACANLDDPTLREGAESQCGATWDAQNVESYAGTAAVSSAFVMQHQRPVGYHVNVGCSGTLISNDLFLSAGHCAYAAGHTVRFNYQRAPGGTLRAASDFVVDAVVEQENNGTWDYAIVRLRGNPGAQFGHARLGVTDPAAGSQVVIIQHPDREPKMVHVGPVVDYSSSIGSNWFRHAVDTTGGSSGSGVLNLAGQLVGVHTNAGCGTGSNVGGNSAIRMTQLVAHSATLRGLVRGAGLHSERNAALMINAWGGARHGAEVRLSAACTRANPDCTWTYRDGMLLSDRDQRLAINAWGGAAYGASLRLHEACTPANPDCTWTLRDGVFYSDRDPRLAINAWGGAVDGAALRLHNACTPSNPDCAWQYRNVMVQSGRDRQLAMNAWGGATYGAALRLHNGCAMDNPDCTFTLARGVLRSDRNAALAANAWGSAAQGIPLRLHNACTASNPDCTFSIARGLVGSGRNPALSVNAWGGAQYGTELRLYLGCPASNPDCTFTLAGN